MHLTGRAADAVLACVSDPKRCLRKPCALLDRFAQLVR
jgi:hypothetical protein